MMKSPMEVKQAQQLEHLRMLRECSAAQKAKIVLENSGFAAAIHKNRHLVSIQFGK
jgi:hypothetical protein